MKANTNFDMRSLQQPSSNNRSTIPNGNTSSSASSFFPPIRGGGNSSQTQSSVANRSASKTDSRAVNGGASTSMGFSSGEYQRRGDERNTRGPSARSASALGHHSKLRFTKTGALITGDEVSLPPSHVLRNAYGVQIRSIVKENAVRREEAVDNSHAPRSPTAAAGVTGSCDSSDDAVPKKKGRKPSVGGDVVDINAREDAARRRAVAHAIDCKKEPTYTVDWSGFGATDVSSLRQKVPRVGELFKVHKDSMLKVSAERAESEMRARLVAEHERLKDIYTFGEGTKQSVLKNPDQPTNQLTYVKAKDKTYAFVDKRTELVDSAAGKKVAVGTWLVRNEQGVMEEKRLSGNELEQHEEQMKLYRCTLLRLNANRITSVDTFGKDVKNLLFRPFEFLTFVDLSSNLIAHLPTPPSPYAAILATMASGVASPLATSTAAATPTTTSAPFPSGGGGGGGSGVGFEGLQIHTLLLHDNKIDDVQELFKLQCLSATLRKLTLYGNPLQRKVHPDMRPLVIAILPFLTVLDDTPVNNRERADQQNRAVPPAFVKAQQEREKLQAKAHKDFLRQQQQFQWGGGGGLNATAIVFSVNNSRANATILSTASPSKSPARSPSPTR